MIYDRASQPLDKVTCVRKKAQLVFEMCGRVIDDVGDAILQAAGGERMKHVEDSDRFFHNGGKDEVASKLESGSESPPAERVA